MRKDDEKMSDDKKPSTPDGLLHDRPHTESGRVRAAVSVKVESADKKPEPMALQFPRHQNSEDGWTIDFNFLANFQNKITPEDGYPCLEDIERVLLTVEKIYTPPAREWVRLTEDDTRTLLAAVDHESRKDKNAPWWQQLISAAERMLKEKNT